MDKSLGWVLIFASIVIWLLTAAGGPAWGWVLAPVALIVGVSLIIPKGWL